MEVNLVMFKAKSQRKDFPILNELTLIGRGSDCDLRVPVLSVSRKHCELTVNDAGASIRDLGSSNGTYVNNERVDQQALQAGDRLVVGPIAFTVQIDGEPAEIHPVKTRGQMIAEKTTPNIDELINFGDMEDSGELEALDETSAGVLAAQIDGELGVDAEAEATLEELIEPEPEAEGGKVGGEEGGEEEFDPLSALEAASENEEEDQDK